MPRARLLGLADLAPGARSAWAELAERAVEPNPFFHPDLVLAAARAYGAMGDAAVLAVEGPDGWLGALPVRPEARFHRVPAPNLGAWLHQHCFLGTPLLAPEDPAGAWRALLDGLGRGRLFGELDLCDAAGPVGAARAQATAAGAIEFGAVERPAVLRRPENDYLADRVSGKHRRNLRRAGRDLAAEAGGDLALTDRAGSGAAVDAFLALEAAGWKGERGTALAVEPGGREFFTAVCRDFAARGALQLLDYHHDGRTVAMRCNLRAGDTISCIKIAHDETLRKHSPGTQLELAMLDHFHADPTARRMDSCADPRSELFNRLWPDRKALSGVLVPRGGPAGALSRPLLRRAAAELTRRRAAD